MVDAAQGIAGVEAVVAIFIREDLAQGIFGAIRIGAELSQGQEGGAAVAAVAGAERAHEVGDRGVGGRADAAQGFGGTTSHPPVIVAKAAGERRDGGRSGGSAPGGVGLVPLAVQRQDSRRRHHGWLW